MAGLVQYRYVRVVQDRVSVTVWELHSSNALQLWGSVTLVVVEMPLAPETWMALHAGRSEQGLHLLCPNLPRERFEKTKSAFGGKKKKIPEALF